MAVKEVRKDKEGGKGKRSERIMKEARLKVTAKG
jgi:hypothetical protein